MKISEIRNMTSDELNEKLTDTSKKLSQLKFNNSVQTIENPLEIKILRRQLAKTKKYVAHDENNDWNEGETVRSMETRPVSKTKKWRIVEIIERAK